MADVKWRDVRFTYGAMLAEFAQVGRSWGSVMLIVKHGEPRPYTVKCEVRDGVNYKFEKPYVSMAAAVAAYTREKEKATERLAKCT
jgi:hypothetical protein